MKKNIDFPSILKINDELNHIKDLDSLLDRVLYYARKLTNADAGSLYLLHNNKLSFDYVQNDTLIGRDFSNKKYFYSKKEINVNKSSIAGYVAISKQPLIIKDVYSLNPNLPFKFNKNFDRVSSYRTKSMVTIPLITLNEKIIGVIQIINAKSKKGEIIDFSDQDVMLVSHFASYAASAIERARMTREIILRMIKIAELRDPEETTTHVHRVSSYSIEIYQHWAEEKGIDENKIKKTKDILRIGAMLHDVGKVAISDRILKKRTRLTEKEYEKMKNHTIYGAKLFQKSNSEWDNVSMEIVLNHHEKWDGSGYPGYINISNDKLDVDTVGKKGEDIPFTARIVAIADVYDALSTKRSYKEPWDDEKILKYIKKEKAKSFDPELVESFLSIYDVIRAIKEKYS